MEYQSHSPLGISENSVHDLKIFPNPANDVINIKFSNVKDQKVALELISVTGQQLRYREFFAEAGSSSENINVTTLPEGIYFLRIIGEEEVLIRKLLIKRN